MVHCTAQILLVAISRFTIVSSLFFFFFSFLFHIHNSFFISLFYRLVTKEKNKDKIITYICRSLTIIILHYKDNHYYYYRPDCFLLLSFSSSYIIPKIRKWYTLWFFVIDSSLKRKDFSFCVIHFCGTNEAINK